MNFKGVNSLSQFERQNSIAFKVPKYHGSYLPPYHHPLFGRAQLKSSALVLDLPLSPTAPWSPAEDQKLSFPLRFPWLHCENASSCKNAVVHIQGHSVALVLHKEERRRGGGACVSSLRCIQTYSQEDEKAVVKPCRLSRNTFNVQLVITFTKGLYVKLQK